MADEKCDERRLLLSNTKCADIIAGYVKARGDPIGEDYWLECPSIPGATFQFHYSPPPPLPEPEKPKGVVLAPGAVITLGLLAIAGAGLSAGILLHLLTTFYG